MYSPRVITVSISSWCQVSCFLGVDILLHSILVVGDFIHRILVARRTKDPTIANAAARPNERLSSAESSSRQQHDKNNKHRSFIIIDSTKPESHHDTAMKRKRSSTPTTTSSNISTSSIDPPPIKHRVSSPAIKKIDDEDEDDNSSSHSQAYKLASLAAAPADSLFDSDQAVIELCWIYFT